MLLLVHLQRTHLRESLWTIYTSVWFNTCMYALVTNKMALMMKALAADVTHIRTFVRMCSIVNFQVKSLEKSLTTGQANMIALL